MLVSHELIEVGVSMFPGFEPYADFYSKATDWAGIKSVRAHAMFLAQTAHECQGYTVFEENLNYSKNRLIAVWPNRFRFSKITEPVDENGKLKDGKYSVWEMGGNPEKIANCVYGGRGLNGPAESGDGWKYRGRGPIMLTFFSGYADFENDCGFRFPGMDFTEDPDLLFNPEVGMWSAAWFFKSRNVIPYADAGNVIGATRKINGGQNGVKERNILYNKILSELGIWR